MTVDQLVGKVYNRLKDKDFVGTEGKLAIQVNMTGKVAGVFYVEILDGVLSVMPYEYMDRDAAIGLTMTNFDRILSGKLNPQVAIAEGKMKIDGNVDKVMLFMELLKA